MAEKGLSRRRNVPLFAVALLLTTALAWWVFGGANGSSVTYLYFGATMAAESPGGDPDALMILVAKVTGDSRTHDLSRQLLGQNIATVIVSLPDLQNAIGQRDCVSLSQIFHAIAKDAEHRLSFPEYRLPVLGGVGEGALAAYVGYRQSGAGMWSGMLTVDRSSEVSLSKPPCLNWGRSGDAPGRYRIDLSHRPGETWVDIDDFSEGRLDASIAPLLKNVRAPLGSGDMPVTLVEPAKVGPEEPVAIMFFGDGGWAGFDRKMAAEFNRRGVPVVGISSLEYFWKERQPAEAARDL